MMVTTVQRWGNGQGLRFSKRILQASHISVGDNVDIAVRNGIIVITPIKRMRRKVSLRNLVSRIPKEYRPEETDWGTPVGREA